MSKRWATTIALGLALGCGGRSTIGIPESSENADGGPGSMDATFSDVIVRSDAAEPTDGPIAVDAGIACTPPMTQVGLCGGGNCCKMDLTWSCGTTMYRFGGACDSRTTDTQSGFFGECRRDGQGTKTISSSDPMGCSCTDLAATEALIAKLCGYPIAGSTQ